MRMRPSLLAASLVLALSAEALAQPAADARGPAAESTEAERGRKKQRGRVAEICDLIAKNALANALPESFFARLIWKESRFDANAVSPAGAEGIAQFMPATAALRGLENSFDIAEALQASAAYLAELRTKYGNLGLAAAAYNAGEGRISRWLASGGFLPLETEGYVLDILGASADSFIGAKESMPPPLDPKKSFAEACRDLPIVRFNTTPMARISTKPWAVQVAGNPRRAAAVRQFERVKRRLGSLVKGHEVAVSRVRSPRGRRGIYVVRLGLESRSDANELCRRLRDAGGSCIVRRNR